jgi:hypothetical protein
MASEEEFLEYSEIRVVSPERKDTGKVVFAAKASEDKILAVNVEAFGKKFDVAKEDLEKLAGFPLSSLVITHEAGYERTGGHMVHFKLKKRSVQKDQLVEEQALISVTVKKGLSVWKLEKVVQPQAPAK